MLLVSLLGDLSLHLEPFDDLVVRIAQAIVVYDSFFKKVDQIDPFKKLVERPHKPGN